MIKALTQYGRGTPLAGAPDPPRRRQHIGMRNGSALLLPALRLNNSQGYFGQTVNIAARVQGLASWRAIFVTQPVVEDPNAAKILQSQSLRPSMRRAALRGIADETTVHEIP